MPAFSRAVRMASRVPSFNSSPGSSRSIVSGERLPILQALHSLNACAPTANRKSHQYDGDAPSTSGGGHSRTLNRRRPPPASSAAPQRSSPIPARQPSSELPVAETSGIGAKQKFYIETLPLKRQRRCLASNLWPGIRAAWSPFATDIQKCR